MITSKDWIRRYELMPHPEGGYFRESYKSSIEVNQEQLPEGFTGSRKLVTSIIYLLHLGEVSKLHRLKSDEMWFYHYGSSLKIEMIDKKGIRSTCILGPAMEAGEVVQYVIPAGTIFGGEITGTDVFGVYGCIVAPGFEFNDFEIFNSDDLLQKYPKHKDIIRKYL